MALAVYYEARSEPLHAQLAVAQVIMQRTASPSYPDTVCGVVTQGEYGANGIPIRHRCQFSYHCDGKPERPRDRRAWRRARAVAALSLNGIVRYPALDGVLHYHAEYVTPVWSHGMSVVGVYGSHVFLKE